MTGRLMTEYRLGHNHVYHKRPPLIGVIGSNFRIWLHWPRHFMTESTPCHSRAKNLPLKIDANVICPKFRTQDRHAPATYLKWRIADVRDFNGGQLSNARGEISLRDGRCQPNLGLVITV